MKWEVFFSPRGNGKLNFEANGRIKNGLTKYDWTIFPVSVLTHVRHGAGLAWHGNNRGSWDKGRGWAFEFIGRRLFLCFFLVPCCFLLLMSLSARFSSHPPLRFPQVDIYLA
jgi:hypothetical protein